MAKKAKRTKRSKRKTSKPPFSLEPDCTVELEFTDAVTKEPETLRRLAHRVVERLADNEQHDSLSGFVTYNLAGLADGFVIDRVTDLLEEARAAGKEAPRG